MSDTTVCRPPIDCTDRERREFARLVRQGFPRARNLEARIRDAKWLAFHYAGSGGLTAVAALKAPGERFREDLFRRADAPADAADYELELGWVFVAPAHRGNRIADRLCRLLLANVPTAGVFATTRPGNAAMLRILHALGFARVGRPYPRRDEELVLLVRPSPPHLAPEQVRDS